MLYRKLSFLAFAAVFAFLGEANAQAAPTAARPSTAAPVRRRTPRRHRATAQPPATQAAQPVVINPLQMANSMLGGGAPEAPANRPPTAPANTPAPMDLNALQLAQLAQLAQRGLNAQQVQTIASSLAGANHGEAPSQPTFSPAQLGQLVQLGQQAGGSSALQSLAQSMLGGR